MEKFYLNEWKKFLQEQQPSTQNNMTTPRSTSGSDESYELADFAKYPNVQKFLTQNRIDVGRLIKPIPPATSINFKKKNGQYIGLGNMEFFAKNIDLYYRSQGVIRLFNAMIADK